MKHRKMITAVFCLLITAGMAHADVVIATGDATAHDDLFEAANVEYNYNLNTSICEGADLFGLEVGTTEPGNIFANNDNALILEFTTASAVSLNTAVVSLASDENSANRGATSAKLYAWIDGDWALQFSTALNPDYTGAYGSSQINVTATFDTVTSDYFRFEVESYSGVDGARICELDAYEIIPEPASMAMIGLAGISAFFIRRTFMM